jgi:hypothetical protein
VRAIVSVVTGRTDPGTNGDGYGSLGRGPGEAVWASRMASASKLSTVPLNTATPRDLGARFLCSPYSAVVVSEFRESSGGEARSLASALPAGLQCPTLGLTVRALGCR